MTDAAIKARYVNFKRFPSSKTFQIILEVPIEHAAMVLEHLGHPAEDGSTEVGVARLQEPQEAKPEKKSRSWDQLSRAEQAGIACNDPDFIRYLDSHFDIPGIHPIQYQSAAAEAVRHICGVLSRGELDKQAAATARWNNLYSDFQLWKRGAAA